MNQLFRATPLLVLLLGPFAGAQTAAPPTDKDTPVRAAESALDPEQIGEFDGVLASDAFDGREAGTRGEQRASTYIVSLLQDCPALQPDAPDGSWLQPFEITLHKEPAVAHNVLARLPGSDPKFAGQFIVLGAHFDHVGFGHSGNTLDPGNHEVHNGADDNGSGSSVLLDLATSIANSGWRPRRTLLFQWYSGEELGLLGSKYWVAHPTHPVADVVFMLNMDMVGRMVGRTLVVGGTGTSPELSAMVKTVSDGLDLTILDDPPGSAPSDNSSFYEAGIPALFLFTGLHDDYHRATDDTEKLDLDGARDTGRLALRMVSAVDLRDERLPFHTSPGMAYDFKPHVYIGVAFEDSAPPAPAGARVAVVVPDTPAALAGLREGDVVTACNGQPITRAAELQALLKTHAGPVAPVELEFWRGPAAHGLEAPSPSQPGETQRIVVHPTIR
jgi:Peptidase family M28/PDZ domain